MHNQRMQGLIPTLLFCLSMMYIGTAATGGIIDKSTPSITAVEEAMAESGERLYNTFFLIYTDDVKDDLNNNTLLSCEAPPNVTFTVAQADMLKKWTVPPGVKLISQDNDKNKQNPTIDTKPMEDKSQNARAWVELTQDNDLIFHNPDHSITGPYVCHSSADDQEMYQTTVWVHVLGKHDFNVAERLKVGFTAGILSVAITLGCIGAVYCYNKRKVKYSPAKCQDDHMDIPAIKIVSASSEDI